MIDVILVGAGNVATHLFEAFSKAQHVEVIQVYNRSKKPLEVFCNRVETTTAIEKIGSADVYIVAVKDDAVKPLIEQIAIPNRLLVHTSGSVPMLDTIAKNGVFYPVQSFTRGLRVDFSAIPVAIEAADEKSFSLLKELAESISHNVVPISTQQRRTLHLAAVFANNFTNYMFTIAERLCREKAIPFEVLHALIQETTKKAIFSTPEKGQTGPAIRDDRTTISRHLSQLDDPILKEIYTLLTQAIQKNYGKKL